MGTCVSQENIVKCDDGKYHYLLLSSEKKDVCTLNIYENDPSGVTIYMDTLKDFFRERDMKKISWGVNSYDLFFQHRERGVYCFKFENGEWVGELCFDAKRTKGEFEKGNRDVYYFKGDRKVKSLVTKQNPGGFENIEGAISRENIPTYFLDQFDDQLTW